jgi:hypothetical protein
MMTLSPSTAGLEQKPCSVIAVSNLFSMVALMIVPAGTRITGPGNCNGFPFSAKA